MKPLSPDEPKQLGVRFEEFRNARFWHAGLREALCVTSGEPGRHRAGS